MAIGSSHQVVIKCSSGLVIKWSSGRRFSHQVTRWSSGLLTPIHRSDRGDRGVQGNPLTSLAEQLGCRLHRLDRSHCPLYDGSELLPVDVDKRAEAMFNELMEKTSQLRTIR